MQMKKSQLQVTKAYYSKAVKATVQKQHLRNKKSISNICVVVLLFITGGGGGNSLSNTQIKDVKMHIWIK